jgi:hypothetical protein
VQIRSGLRRRLDELEKIITRLNILGKALTALRVTLRDRERTTAQTEDHRLPAAVREQPDQPAHPRMTR